MLEPKLIEPKEIEIDNKLFIISKFPAVEGREISAGYMGSEFPKIDPTQYKANEETMLKLMKYVAIKVGDKTLSLTSKDLINNHTGNWQTLLKIENAMLEYNCNFLTTGRV